MIKLMKIRSTIKSCGVGVYEVTSQHYDGTPFIVKANSKQIQFNDPLEEENQAVSGFLYVEQVGEQGDRAFIVLPTPSIQYGKNICVSTNMLRPMHDSIENYIKKE